MEALFGDWAAGPVPAVAPGSRGPRIRHVPHDSQQTHIALAWSAPPYHADASYEATAALAVLGGGSSSRLFSEVRERRGLCYSVSAGYQTHRDFAMAVCYSGTTAARAQETPAEPVALSPSLLPPRAIPVGGLLVLSRRPPCCQAFCMVVSKPVLAISAPAPKAAVMQVRLSQE